eukprot:gene38591-4160_t
MQQGSRPKGYSCCNVHFGGADGYHVRLRYNGEEKVVARTTFALQDDELVWLSRGGRILDEFERLADVIPPHNAVVNVSVTPRTLGGMENGDGDDAATPTRAASAASGAGSASAVRRERTCDACGKEGQGMKFCKRCKRDQRAWYCSVECQRAHFPKHKLTCGEAATAGGAAAAAGPTPDAAACAKECTDEAHAHTPEAVAEAAGLGKVWRACSALFGAAVREELPGAVWAPRQSGKSRGRWRGLVRRAPQAAAAGHSWSRDDDSGTEPKRVSWYKGMSTAAQ